METQIKVLRDLMVLDKEYFDLRNRLNKIPQDLAQLDQHETALRRALLADESRLTQCQRDRRQLEAQIQDRQETRRKYEQQLYEIRENRELQSLQREIEYLREGLSELEEKAVALLELEETLEKEIRTLREEAKGKQGGIEAKRKKLDAEFQEIDRSVQGMVGSRDLLIEALGPPIRSKYKRIVTAKGHGAIVPVGGDGSCGGCYYKLPPQTVAEVKIGAELIVCEGCGKILVTAHGNNAS